jgi:hypothetical protein
LAAVTKNGRPPKKSGRPNKKVAAHQKNGRSPKKWPPTKINGRSPKNMAAHQKFLGALTKTGRHPRRKEGQHGEHLPSPGLFINVKVNFCTLIKDDAVFVGLATVIECQCAPVGTDPTGQLNSAFMIPRSKFVIIQYDPTLLYSRPAKLDGAEGPTLYMDVLIETGIGRLSFVLIGRLWNGMIALILTKVEGEEETFQRMSISTIDLQLSEQGPLCLDGERYKNPFDVEDSTIKII